MTGDIDRLRQAGFAGLIGSARVDITPPHHMMGIYARNWGAAKHDHADGVHRPLCAYALVLGGEKNQPLQIIVTLDLVTWCSHADEFGIREPLLKHFALSEDQLMMHISHNHSAPLTDMVFADKPGGEFVAPYRAFLIEQLKICVESALNACKSSVLSWQIGHCQLAFNRNYPDLETGDIICGINPYCAADDTVLVGRITDINGVVTAVFVNYACHPTTLGAGNTKLSPDYPGAMRTLLEDKFQGADCLFLHGASGDLGPRIGYVADTEIADKNGYELGYAVLSALEAMLPPQTQLTFSEMQSSGAPLGIWDLKPTTLPSQIQANLITVELEAKDLPSISELQQSIEQSGDRAAIERYERMLMLSQFIDGRKVLPLKLWVWKIGSAFIVGTPTEMHSEFQQKLRRDHPDVTIAVLNIVNGYTSYLPPRQDYPGLSYQVRVSVFKAGAAEKVRAVISQQIGTMKS